MKEKTLFSLMMVSSIAGFIPSIVIAYFAMKFLNEGWGFFWFVLIGIGIFYFVVWLLRGILNYFLYNVLWKHRLVDDVYSNLVKYKFPNPDEYYSPQRSPQDYYVKVIDDDSLDCELRIYATGMGSIFGSLTGGGAYLTLWRTIKIHDAALNKYKELHFQTAS